MQPSRSPLILALLVLTMLLTAFLAWQAQDAVRSNRQTAQRVLKDYSDLAASEYVQRIRPELEYYAYQPALKLISDHRRQAQTSNDVPAPSPIVVMIDEDSTLSIDLVSYNFHLRFDGTELVTRGEALAPETRRWLADTLLTDARSRYKANWPSATVIGSSGGDSHQIVYQAERDASGAIIGVSGFEADSAGMAVYFDYSYAIAPLIPPALTRGVAQDSLVAMAVLSPHGAALYRSKRQYHSALTAQAEIGPRFGGMVARATLHPAFPETIVIEGPPRRQLPLLIGLFVVTMGLMTAALVQLRRETELARLRSDFVSSVSHELKTPLAQIRLFAETLLLGRVRSAGETRRSLEIIDQEARRLTHLVENVLHFSRAERRSIQLSLETIDLSRLGQEIAESFIPLAKAHQATVALAIEDGVMALVDPGSVRQIVINLLDNALKYGPPGQTITVGLRWLAPADAGEGRAQLHVDDGGPGVAVQDRKRIWERFTRLGQNGSSGIAGTGIGLSVVRELAELHGGRAWVEDAAAGGARFLVELPHAWRGDPPVEMRAAVRTSSGAEP